MRHFPLPIHAAVVAATVVAGLASYQGVDKLVLARGGSQYETGSEPGHEPSSSTSTTVKHEGSTTSTTVHHEPTSSTVPHEPGPTTTTVKHEPEPTPPTTTHKEPGPVTSTTVAPKPPPPTPARLSFGCISGFTGGQGASKCTWSQSYAPNFGHYRLTRELVGTPRQTVFETSDRGTTSYYDLGLQAGAQYSYIIEAYDTAGNLIASGGPFHFTCCGGGGTT